MRYKKKEEFRKALDILLSSVRTGWYKSRCLLLIFRWGSGRLVRGLTNWGKFWRSTHLLCPALRLRRTTESVSQPALMERASSGTLCKETDKYRKTFKVLVMSLLGYCALFVTPYSEDEGKKSIRKLLERTNRSGNVEPPMLETFQKSLDKHSPQVVFLCWILLGRGGGTGDFLSSPLVLFSSTLWLLSSYCRSAGKVKEILA